QRFHPLLVAIALLTPALPATATIVDLSSNTDGWTPIRYSNNNPDPSNDQQTGSSEGDIVGNALHPSAYTIFGDGGTPSTTDGTLGFRVRLGADVNPAGFKTALFVGIDANHGGAQPDFFLSFSIPLSDIIAQLAAVGITGFDENSTLNYVIATATQANSLNQDLNGVDKNYDGAMTWSLLGVLSDPISVNGISVVPEVNPGLWIVLLLGAVAGQRWFSKRTTAKRQRVLAGRR